MFRQLFQVIIGSTLILLTCSSAYSDTVIRINTASGDKANYIVQLVQLAYDKLDKKLTIKGDNTKISQGRINEEVANGNLDLMWVSTSIKKEEDFLPVRIPLYKGLLGYRIMFIRKGEQHKFNNISTVDDLRSFKLGQGRTWADTEILEANNLTVVKATRKDQLFNMLDGCRFDAFPRGSNEPFKEIQKYSNLDIAIEKNIALSYHMPFYIFVNKSNATLAADIEQGLNLAIADGSFDKLFYANPTVKDALKKARLTERRIIKLSNPTLPAKTPINREELWLRLDTLGSQL